MTPSDPSIRELHQSGPHLKLALLFGVAGILATLALMPYLVAMMPLKLAATRVPLWMLLPPKALQAGVLCWALGWLGLFLGARFGLDAPWLRAWIYRQPRHPSRQARWWLATLLGVLAALLVWW